MKPTESIIQMAEDAKGASASLLACTSAEKDRALARIAEKLRTSGEKIKAENARDLEFAQAKGLSAAMIDRLTVSDDTISGMATGLEDIIQLDDPVGRVVEEATRPNGLLVSRIRVPIGVIGIIYESRPNVTIDSAGLCLKAGNAVILRGGSEAFHSNQVLAGIVAEALKETGLPAGAVQVVSIKGREAVDLLLKQEDTIDLIIPRGGEGLIRFVAANSRIPVLKHYKGVCHVYVDKKADLKMARGICFNAKVQRPGVCNAMETLLVHRSVAADFLPSMAAAFTEAAVKLRGCGATRTLIPEAEAATEADWHAEYLDLILAVKIVDSMEEAMDHIAAFGSNHTEAIVTADAERAGRFTQLVDASVVLTNASTRFNDGGQLGLGAEIGISTTKLHAYGPMGLKELTTTKFVVKGDGQVRT
jgi:glutamate-5-semialdehyde dehydrogenase